jgi:hypothetical protein
VDEQMGKPMPMMQLVIHQINNVHKGQQVTPTSQQQEGQKHGPVVDKVEVIQALHVQHRETQYQCVEQQHKHMQMERQVMEQTPFVHRAQLAQVHQHFLLHEQV